MLKSSSVFISIDLTRVKDADEFVSAQAQLNSYAESIAEQSDMGKSFFFQVNQNSHRFRGEATAGLNQESGRFETRDEGHELPPLLDFICQQDHWLQCASSASLVKSSFTEILNHPLLPIHLHTGLTFYMEAAGKKYQGCLDHVLSTANQHGHADRPIYSWLEYAISSLPQFTDKHLPAFFNIDFPFMKWISSYISSESLMHSSVADACFHLSNSPEAILSFLSYYNSKECHSFIPDFSSIFPSWKERKQSMHDYKRFLPTRTNNYMFSISIPVLNGNFLFQLSSPFFNPDGEGNYFWAEDKIDALKEKLEEETPKLLLNAFRRNYSIVNRELSLPLATADLRSHTLADYINANPTAVSCINDNALILDILSSDEENLSRRIGVASKHVNTILGVYTDIPSDAEYVAKRSSEQESITTYQAFLLFKALGLPAIDHLIPHRDYVLTRSTVGISLPKLCEHLPAFFHDGLASGIKTGIFHRILDLHAAFITHAPHYLASVRKTAEHAAKFHSTVLAAFKEHDVAIHRRTMDVVESYGRLLEQESSFHFLDGNPLNEHLDFKPILQYQKSSTLIPLNEFPVLEKVAEEALASLSLSYLTGDINEEGILSLFSRSYRRLDFEVCNRMTTLSDSFHELVGRPQTVFDSEEEHGLHDFFFCRLEAYREAAMDKGIMDHADVDFSKAFYRTYLPTGIYRLLREWEIELNWLLPGYSNRPGKDLIAVTDHKDARALVHVKEKMEFYLRRTLSFLEELSGRSCFVPEPFPQDPHEFFRDRIVHERPYFEAISDLLSDCPSLLVK